MRKERCVHAYYGCGGPTAARDYCSLLVTWRNCSSWIYFGQARHRLADPPRAEKKESEVQSRRCFSSCSAPVSGWTKVCESFLSLAEKQGGPFVRSAFFRLSCVLLKRKDEWKNCNSANTVVYFDKVLVWMYNQCLALSKLVVSVQIVFKKMCKAFC